MGRRRADFAGSWYPGSKSDCIRAIEGFIASSLPCPHDSSNAIGGIVPHAGWFYSGKIACNVIKCLSSQTDVETFLIFGRHLHPGSDLYLMAEGSWNTPLGELEIDSQVAKMLCSEFTFRLETHASYEPDNTIELQLPFIKYFFPNARIVPVGAPPNLNSLKVARRAAEISNGMDRKTLVLGSTDLTHYGYNYGFIPRGVGEDAVEWVRNVNDKKVVDLMVKMDAEGVIRESLANHNACCSGAAAGAIAAAKTLGSAGAYTIEYLTSYDIRPDSSFVGYVGIIFYE